MLGRQNIDFVQTTDVLTIWKQTKPDVVFDQVNLSSLACVMIQASASSIGFFHLSPAAISYGPGADVGLVATTDGGILGLRAVLNAVIKAGEIAVTLFADQTQVVEMHMNSTTGSSSRISFPVVPITAGTVIQFAVRFMTGTKPNNGVSWNALMIQNFN